jgi:hypothetical protein
VLRVGAGKTAMKGSVEDQNERIGNEAGVREQL